jgi:putative ABC transport system permease protein
MTAPWQKVVRDLWQEKTRTTLVVLAMALGIAAFAAVLSSYAILTRELNAGYLATNPASFTLRTDAVDRPLLEALASHPGVAGIQTRRTLSGRIKAAHGGWRRLILFVLPDFRNLRISTIASQQGTWPPGTGEILIERDALQVIRARTGEMGIIQTSAGQERALRIAGSVHDVGQAQARMENIVYGYITPATLAQLGEEPFLDQLKIVVRGNRLDESHIRAVAASVSKLVESRKHPVRSIDIPTPGRHPHADIMGLLLLIMVTFGLFVVFLSGVLVVNLLMALMASEVRLIGVMKAIGATRGQIARIYLGQALLLGVAAIAIALPAGLWGSRILSSYLALFLNFDINSFAVPLWVFLLLVTVGLVVPLLSAAWPVWQGSGVSVLQAMTDFGVAAGDFGIDRFDRMLSGVGGMLRPLLLAIRNSFRRRTRLVLTVATLAMGGLVFMSALNIRASMIQTLDRLFRSKKFDLSVSLANRYPIATIERAIRKTPGIRRAEGWITTEGWLSGTGTDSVAGSGAATSPSSRNVDHLHENTPSAVANRFTVIAMPVETDLLRLEMLEGRSVLPGETDAMIVNNALATREHLKVGNAVRFRTATALPAAHEGRGTEVGIEPPPPSRPWRIVGIAREPFSPPVAYLPLRYFDPMHPGTVNSLRVALVRTDAASIESVKENLERSLEREGVSVLGSLSKADSRYGFDQHMLMIYVFLIVVSGILTAVGGLGIMTSMSLNVLERRREMGVLRAIGATPGAVWLIVVTEGAVVALLSWALAALAAWPVSAGIGNLLVTVMFKNGLDFHFEWRGVLIWLAISLTLAALASFLPAWHASRRSVREALGYA